MRTSRILVAALLAAAGVLSPQSAALASGTPAPTTVQALSTVTLNVSMHPIILPSFLIIIFP